MSKPGEAGLAFLADVLGKIPEDRRTAVQTLIDTNPELVEAIGAGTLRQQEFSRGMDQIKRVEQEQQAWYTTSQDLLALGQKAKEAGFDPTKPTTPASALPENVLRRDDLDQREAGYAQFVMETNFLQASHLREFGEPINLADLARDPRVKDLGLRGVYEATVAPKRDERRKQETDAEVTRRVNEGVAAALKAQGHPAYPSNNAPTPGSPLDALQPVAASGGDVDSYVDAYHALVAAQR